MGKKKQQIAPYVQHGAVVNRQHDMLKTLEKEPAAATGRPEFAIADQQQLEEALRQQRLRG